MRKRFRFDSLSLSPELFKRIGLLALLFLILGAAQCSFFARLDFLPATPDLMLAAVCALLLLEERPTVWISAVSAGFLIDVMGGSAPVLSPLFYLAVTVILAIPAQKMLPRFLSWMLLMLPATALRLLVSAIRLTLAEGFRIFPEALWRFLLPELLSTVLLSIPVFFLVKLCVYLVGDRREGRLR